MKLDSVGILIGMRPFGERDVVARVFSRDFGVLCGVMRGAQVAKKNKPLVGQLGAVSWNARLDSQLGAFHWDAERNLSAPVLASRAGLAMMNAVFELIATLLPEREAYTDLYQHTVDLLPRLADCATARDSYLRWEIELLRDLGYALDLSVCGGCGTCNNLHWLSPRTGRAVCDNCAGPYIDKLYKLPLNLSITQHFLTQACQAQGVQIPTSRTQLYLVNS